MRRTIILVFGWMLIGVMVMVGQSQPLEVLSSKSTITYQLNHKLHHVEAISTDGWFRLEVDPLKREIRSVKAQVDVMTFDSGNSNRDSHAMEVIESLKYPDVTFTSTSIRTQADSILVTGKLTFHGVTGEILMKGITTWSEKTLTVHGTFDITLTAFKVERPSLLMIPVDDELRFSLIAAFTL